MFGLVDRNRRKVIETYEFPQGLAERVRRSHPHLDDAQLGEVLRALRDWFQVCLVTRLRTFVGMPSVVVDDAWHEFILFTRAYQSFCQAAFGRYLHHTPSEGLGEAGRSVLADGLDRTWTEACRLEGLSPSAPARLPRLFAIDADLGIDGGHVYVADDFVARERIRSRRAAASGLGGGRAAAAPGVGCGGGSGCGGSGGGCAGGGCGGGGCGGG